METSESIKEIASALSKFQSEMKPLELDREVEVKGTNKRTNKEYKYNFKYASLENIIEATRKLLSNNELAFVQPVGEGGKVTTLLMHSSGEWIKDSVLISPAENSPQAIGSSISYAKRYSLSAMLGLVAEQDDDANIAQGSEFTMKKKEENKTEEKPGEKNKTEEKPKQDELPWLSEKGYNTAIKNLETENEIFVENEGMLTREGFVKWLKETYRMKRIYKEGLDMAFKKATIKKTNNGNITEDSTIPY